MWGRSMGSGAVGTERREVVRHGPVRSDRWVPPTRQRHLTPPVTGDSHLCHVITD
jgi:hypothetical protein